VGEGRGRGLIPQVDADREGLGGGKGMEVFGCCRHATRSSVYIRGGGQSCYIYNIYVHIYIYIIGSRLLDKGTDC
jgi:hypothetical protein